MKTSNFSNECLDRTQVQITSTLQTSNRILIDVGRKGGNGVQKISCVIHREYLENTDHQDIHVGMKRMFFHASGHTFLTQSYLLSGGSIPDFVACHCELTIEHILVECKDYRVRSC